MAQTCAPAGDAQVTLGSWPYGWAVSTSGPTLEKRRSRRWESSFR